MVASLRPTIYSLAAVFTAIAFLAVCLRFQSRRIKKQPLGSDDWTIVLALILSVAVTVDIVIMAALGGLGTHAQYTSAGEPVNPNEVVIFGKTVWVLEIMTWPAVGANKISVLLFYKRIFATPGFQRLAWAFIGLVIAWTITFTFALMFSCLPIASNWNFNLPSTCVNLRSLFTTALATDVVTDALILLLPVYKISQLRMPWSRKILVLFIFLLGGLVTVVGIIRIHFVTLIYNALDLTPEADTTWLFAQAYYWTIIETNVGILSACLPTVGPVFEPTIKPIYAKIRTSFTHLISSTFRRVSSSGEQQSRDGEDVSAQLMNRNFQSNMSLNTRKQVAHAQTSQRPFFISQTKLASQAEVEDLNDV